MKLLLLSVAILSLSLRADEPRPQTMREKLRAKIIESLPPPQPAMPPEEKKESESAVVVMKPMVVSESNRARQAELMIAHEKQKKEDQRFSTTKGGTLFSNDRIEVGGWWQEDQGWSFLNLKW